MSGDVQPRKRKDKKKRRDESDNKAAELLARKMSVLDDDEPKEKPSVGAHATKIGPDDIQLHVQSDHGTGGHWCAKLFFFSLMAILAGLIGLILLENRGISDLDTPLSESRFADYLEGWVDEKRESHDDHDVLKSLDQLDEHEHDNEPFEEEHNDQDEDHGDDEAHNDEEHDDDDGDDIDDESNQEDEEIDDGGNNDDEDDNQNENEDEEDDREIDNANTDSGQDDNDYENDNNDNKDNEDDNTDDDNNQEEQLEKSREKFVNENDDEDEGFEDQLSDDNNDDDNSPFEEHVAKAKVDSKSIVTASKELEVQIDEFYEVFNKVAESLDMPKIVADKENAANNEQQKEDDDDDSDDASNEEFIDNDKGEDLHLQKLTEAEENKNDGDEQSEESSSLTIKLFVGLALVVVAHLVLVKRSKSNVDDDFLDLDDFVGGFLSFGDDDEELIEPIRIESNELKRRLTLITATETIPSDVDDEQPDDDEDDDYDEDDLREEDMENDQKERNDANVDDNEEYERNTESEQEDQEAEEEEIEEEEVEEGDESDEIEDVEHLEPVPAEVDTFTQMKNMYRPAQTVIAEEKEQAKVMVASNQKVNVTDENEYEEDVLDSENSDEEEDEGEDEEGDVSDVDDDDLMKRLESKYGKLPESKTSDEEEGEEKWTKVKRSGPQYNDDDFEEELSRTNAMLDDNPTSALKSFEFLIEIKPNSSKAWYGKGKALDELSEERKSNELLKEAIAAYVKAVEFGSLVDDVTFRIYAERCIDRMRFIGQHLKAVPVHDALIKRFNDDPYFRNQLAVTYLLINRLADAKLVLHETLLRWRHDGFALVHYGFVLKNLDKNIEAAAVFLQEGIDSNADGTNDGRFYFNLGEALTRLGRNDEAMAVYRKGASKKLFLSEYQRSLYNVDRLESRPFWTKKKTGYKQFFDILEQNWEKIRDEGLSVLNHNEHFTDESENLRDTGDWKQFDLFARGRKMVKHCEKTPFTCKIIETFPAARFCARGQVKFSVMHPGTHVWPHCGPTNCRIRAHLGLKVPDKTFIRVATETRSWKEGKLLIFDDSFEHEVWHNGTSVRLVLIVDVWHPDLTVEERSKLHPI